MAGFLKISHAATLIYVPQHQRSIPNTLSSYLCDAAAQMQSFQEVNIYVPVPPGIKSKQLFCEIGACHLRFGMHSNPPFLDQDLAAPVKVSESLWTLEDGTLHISLQKLQQVGRKAKRQA